MGPVERWPAIREGDAMPDFPIDQVRAQFLACTSPRGAFAHLFRRAGRHPNLPLRHRADAEGDRESVAFPLAVAAMRITAPAGAHLPLQPIGDGRKIEGAEARRLVDIVLV